MTRNITRLMMLCILFFGVQATAAQALTGTFTIANGNPGSAYDFGDVGAAFDALETSGMSGPVVLELYDAGGPFTSSDAYRLGVSASTFTVSAVTGISQTNTLTIRAAAGNSPVIDAGTTGALNTYTSTGGSGCMAFRNIGNITIEGIEFTGATQFGVMWYSSTAGSSDNLVIRRCTFHTITPGGAIFLYGSSTTTGPVNVDIENNMIWDVEGDAAWAGGGRMGVIGARRLGANVRVRHNTILMDSTGATAAAFQLSGGTPAGFADLSFNAVKIVSGAYFYQKVAATDPLPTTADRNVVDLGPASVTNEAALLTWAQWQTAGYDANGVNADPQLVSTSAPIDVHLAPTSPAIDLAVGSTATLDIDGEPRPKGPAPDSGADEAGDPPDMTLEFTANPVTDGSVVNVGDARTQVGDVFMFTIGNIGLGDLFLVGTPPVTVTTGGNMANASVQTQPALTVIPQSGTTTFTIFIEPSSPGQPFDLVVEILNNDSSKNPFDFTIQGMGILPNDAAEANVIAGSSFAGPTDGPFALSVDPGATLANATIELTDVDLDNILVAAITPLTAVPTGIPTPVIPGAAHPVLLTWTGAADASNPPGDYTWEVEFADTVNLTSVVIEVTVTIADLPPTHVILDATSGDGSSGNPYTVNYFPGATGALAVDLATVTDPNTAQPVNLTGVVQVSGPSGGTGFQFSLAAGVLNVAPAGTLVQADAGNQAFTLVVEDGTHTVLIRVDAFVFGSSGSMFFLNSPNLPFATVDMPYGPETLMVQGGTSPYTFNEISGTWPAGITLNTSTGEISGTPTELGTFSVEIRVVDANNDTLSQTFVLTVRAEVGEGGSGTTRTENNGCSSTTGSTSLLLLALLAGLTGMRYARSRSA